MLPPDKLGSNDQVVSFGVVLSGGVTSTVRVPLKPETKSELLSPRSRLYPPLPLGTTVGPLTIKLGVPLALL
jgi:hypothetical protein